ncbi:hypothetical protein PSECIP111951_00628 [Pseudoalteromonas holothuriae]|uniref:Uncharacterized protein n=1 Tax=Pseudoalteromonas holothuriae TaxID=2963714 RepID=A0A9W4R362_9GAMM|nr:MULTISPECIES: hypothetical protein [unclassified Pseudoalteromonas]CAH9052478.1 hypothetical protein PSECIP111951_00628 [Pseudoalteromonas sp. CIP111951]CAH9064177.1 hypothetical protein PSECIP111854_03384 [Pseudoalteromonas sp. CIP111854]
MNKHNIGRSLASKSPLALLFNVFLFVLLAVFDGTFILSNMLYAIVFGLGCAALLLGYWHEKGGYLFILALLMPLLLVIMSELTSFVALAWVINGYFCGFALALLIYKLSYLKKHSS